MADDSRGNFERGALKRQNKAVNRRFRAATADPVPPAPAPKHKLGARVRYWFDTALSRGPSVVIGWLGALTLAVIVLSALIMTVLRLTGINSGPRLGFAEAFWQSMLRILDAGTFAGDSNWGARALGLVVTLAGIFIAGSLIGLIANAVDQRIEQLRKGRSAVLESDHSLILGWSDRVPAVVRELVVANESRKRAAVVVLADVDKTLMEDTLRDQIEDLRTTRLVCRSGNPSSPADLALVNLKAARSVVVIGGNDAAVVKTLLAVRAGAAADTAAEADPGLRPTLPPLIAEIGDYSTTRSVRALFGDAVVIVNSDAVVAELTAQACRQRGLSQVFRELLDFDGDELYFAPFDALTDRTYAEAQLAFEKSSVMGVMGTDGTIELNPEPHRVLRAGDQLLGIASDDSEFTFTGLVDTPEVPSPHNEIVEEQARRMVLVGWSKLGPRVVAELDEFLGPETTLEIVLDPEVVNVDRVTASVKVHNVNVEITTHEGGPEDVALHAARRAFHEVIVLGRRDGVSAEEADANTLLTLLAFTQVATAQNLGPVRIVAELLEQRHAPLAQATGADDFIVSDELTSLMIAQLSERHELDRVFSDLFDRSGSTIEVGPVDRYAGTSCSTWGQLVAAASAQGHSAIGYRTAVDGKVHVNPAKSESISLAVDDSVVVVR